MVLPPVFVLDVNPSKEKLEELYGGITLENAPEYLGSTEVGPEGAKKKVNQIRLERVNWQITYMYMLLFSTFWNILINWWQNL